MTDTATLYRMVTDDHICPFGLKSKDLLERQGYTVDDHRLTTREQTDRFMQQQGVETTPQTWIGGKRVGGYEALRKFFNLSVSSGDETSYQPIIALFSIAAALAIAMSWTLLGQLLSLPAFEWFIAISMSLLAMQKLQDLESFSTMFLNYDLLAQRWVPYSYIYPFGEAVAGILMVSGALGIVSAPIAITIGTIGAVSVFKAVYIDKRELKCACVGGNSRVPLGFISLTENLMMLAMGLWTAAKLLV